MSIDTKSIYQFEKTWSQGAKRQFQRLYDIIIPPHDHGAIISLVNKKTLILVYCKKEDVMYASLWQLFTTLTSYVWPLYSNNYYLANHGCSRYVTVVSSIVRDEGVFKSPYFLRISWPKNVFQNNSASPLLFE